MMAGSPQLESSAYDAGGDLSWLSGGGRLGALIRARDWTQTRLGPPGAWPQSLRTSISICVNSKFPMLIWWGEERVMIYNDAYADILGEKHPRALGNPGFEAWAEIWDVIGPMLDYVRDRGDATWSEDQKLLMTRFGYREETYFTFSYSPIQDESGRVGGIFCAVSETTERVVGERRLSTLRLLAASTKQHSAPAACAAAASVLASRAEDLPFALIYLADDSGATATLAGYAGLRRGHALAPATLTFGLTEPWPVSEVLRTGQAVTVTGVANELAQTAVVLPLRDAGHGAVIGVLVAGVTPQRPLDDGFRGFLGLVANSVATSIADARAVEAERKRAEALAEIDRAKTAFFSNVSHEFRTPLTLMLGPLEEALRTGVQPRAPLEVAYRNSQRLLKLVNSLLDFSRIEAGRMEASYEPTDLALYTAELASLFRSAVEKAGLRFVVDCATLSTAAHVDRDMWEKIVFNLLSNALKYTLRGEIAVTLRELAAPEPPAGGSRSPLPPRVSGGVALTVRDTGTGIPAAELPRIFDRFHRVRNAQARSQEGTGIGLALVQELAGLHGGVVTVESTEGVGTKFTVTIPLGTVHLPKDKLGVARAVAPSGAGLPYVEEALGWNAETAVAPAGEVPGDLPAASRPQAALPSSGQPERGARLAGLGSGAMARTGTDGGSSAPDRCRISRPGAGPASAGRAVRARVLLADDNRDMREYVERLLAGSGYDVIAVSNGAAALEAVRRDRPQLVLSDVMMPGLDGFGLLEALRSDPATRTIPVILLSARAGEEARVDGVEAGADDYLTKPFAARELLARVETHLRLAQVRKDAAAVVERERRRLYELLMAAPAAICVLRGPEHVFELANPPYLELIGRSADIVGQPLRAVLPEVEAQGYLQVLNGVYTTGEAFVGKERTFQLIRPDGEATQLALNFVYQPTRDAEGRIDGILVHATDVTEPVRARQKVEELAQTLMAERDRAEASERYLRAVLDSTPECVKIVARDGTLLHMNASGLRMVEADAIDAVRGKSVFGLIAPPFRTQFRELHERVCAGETGMLEFDIVGFRGTRRHMETHAVPLRNPDGTVVHLGLTRDVTLRRGAEEAVRTVTAEADRERRLYHAILASTPDFAYVFDRNHRFTYANEALLKMWGRTWDEAIGKNCLELGYPDWHAAMHDREIEQVVATRQPIRGEVPFHGTDGRRMYDYIFVPVIGANGEVEAVAGTTRDVTEMALTRETVAERRNELERLVNERTAKLKQAVEQMEEFSYSVSHDLRAPMRAMRGYAEAVLQDYGDRLDEPGRDLLARIERNGARMDRLIQDLLTYSRLSRRELPRECVALDRLVREVMSQYPEMRPDRATIDVTSVLPDVLAHEPSLTQVISNLLSNAVKFVPAGRRPVVRVGFERRGNNVRLWVQDNGIGIAPQNQGRLFGMFERVHAEQKYEGTGIGLAIVRKAMERMEGRVGMESDGRTGSRFWIEMAACDGRTDAAPPDGGGA